MPQIDLSEQEMGTLRDLFDKHHGTEEDIRALNDRLFEPEAVNIFEGLQERIEQEGTRMREMCFVKDGAIYLNEGQYEITLDRADTPEKILAWAVHLCPKKWVDYRLLRVFINTAAEQAGIEIPSVSAA